ncbi:MAG: PLD nuclease N-terminal domain-containing protein [Actinomycetes bacterium]|jgi:Phospholipase_D-nuclease N-terminal|uniref:Unannotated protein n=1 Tax=freshwater metagenome TaxID=449393 RepID=A0A6J7MI02_9ZZZZ|nr:PLD nuclease N-terminal domain-containing protein [Actinomycetota bacterium]MSW08476.1 hypothetical protein [Actinomycetota bacterium]MSW23345.1 hypothetical protein [Actinomycetota bacterium]MSW75225.1 hypothetical protein [Actinomycetota bacterium]MSY30413.1 hypothetical protein [Actinomycetota bacterium]
MRFFPLLISFIITVYTLVDCARTDNSEIRNLPKWGWILLIVIIGTIGSIAYWILGRPKRQRPPGPGKHKIIPPDDDPDFLRKL